MAYAAVFQEGFMAAAARIARVFRNGRNLAVRIPRGFEFAGRELVIQRQGDVLILSARPHDWSSLLGTGQATAMGEAGTNAVATREILRWIERPVEAA